MTETAVAPAPAAAAPAPAPVSAPVSAPAPVASPAPVAAPAPVETSAPVKSGDPVSALKPGNFKNQNEYVDALLAEQMGALPAEVEEPVAEDMPESAPEVAAPDAEVKPEETPIPEKPVAAEEPEFDFNPPAALTPEALTKMVTDNPEFGKLLESDPKLKGQMYKTTREAAELKPYKEYFPDLESAKEAVQELQSWNGIRDIAMGPVTEESTQAFLAKWMELSYERDDDGNVVMQNGKPVVGDDFFQRVDGISRMEMQNRRAIVQDRLNANQYHVGANTEQERDEAIKRDQAKLAHYDEDLNDVIEPTAQDMPEHVRQALSDVERREKALREQTHGVKVQERDAFDASVNSEMNGRVKSAIDSAMASAEKQGVVMSPYLKRTLPAEIFNKLKAKVYGDVALMGRLAQLQRLPMTDKARQRRVAEGDRSVQQYLPDIVRQEFEAAGVSLLASSKAKAAKIDGQIQKTNQTEPRGSTSPVRTTAKGPMDTKAAMDMAETEWKKANPGRSPRDGQDAIINRVLQLTTQMSA